MYAEYRSLGDGQKFMDREEQIMKRFSEKLVSRNYAKRQLTWFRRDARIRWISAQGKTAEEIAECILALEEE